MRERREPSLLTYAKVNAISMDKEEDKQERKEEKVSARCCDYERLMWKKKKTMREPPPTYCGLNAKDAIDVTHPFCNPVFQSLTPACASCSPSLVLPLGRGLRGIETDAFISTECGPVAPAL